MSVFGKLFSGIGKLFEKKPYDYTISEEEHAKNIAEQRAVLEKIWADHVSQEEREELIHKIMNEEETEADAEVTIPVGYTKYRYPIETWESLGEEELEEATIEWNWTWYLETRDHYRFPFYFYTSSPWSKRLKLFMVYVEIRFNAGQLDEKQLQAIEERYFDRLGVHDKKKRTYEDKEECREEVEDAIRGALDDLGITVREILVFVK